jgi:predicted esterase YcpF (UPF0227 family)
MIEATRAYGVERPCDAGLPTPTTLFLDEGDEVIDFRDAAALYRDCARVLTFPGGDHAFAHMPQAIDLIREALRAQREG